METISLKIEEQILEEIDAKLVKNRYSTRTEFIRDAIRDKLSEIEKDAVLQQLLTFKGAAKKKISDEELHRIREILANQYAKKLGVNLD